jgi:hypothetical protein
VLEVSVVVPPNPVSKLRRRRLHPAAFVDRARHVQFGSRQIHFTFLMCYGSEIYFASAFGVPAMSKVDSDTIYDVIVVGAESRHFGSLA